MRLPAFISTRLGGLLLAGLLVVTQAASPAWALFQFSDAVRNAAADAMETAIGASPILRIYDGTLPASCAAARAGTVVVSMTLPADWLSAASAGSKTLLGTWQDPSADAAGRELYALIDRPFHTLTEAEWGQWQARWRALFAAAQP